MFSKSSALQNLPKLLTRKRSWHLAALILNGFVQAGAMIGIAMVMKTMIDGLTVTGAKQSIWPNALIMVSASFLIGWLKRRERVDAETMGQDYVADIRLTVFQHVSKLSARALGETRKGFVLLRFVNDLTALRQWVTMGIARLAVSGVVLTGAMSALTIMNPILGGLLFALVGLGSISALFLGRSIDLTMRESRKRRANIAANLTEKLEHMIIVQAFAQRNNERRKVKRQTQSLKRAMIARAGAIGTFRAMVYVVVGLALTVSVMVGSVLVTNDMATTGQIMAALGVLSMITPNLFDFGRVYEYRKSYDISLEKTENLLRKGPVIETAIEPKSLKRVQGHLKFDKVTVSGALNEFSAEALPGTCVLITGPNGSGKSTLMLLALRLIEPESGRILLDGRDIHKVKTGQLRRSISIASPTLPLLRGSIGSNIAYGSKTANEDDIQQAAARCGMDGLNSDSPYWLDSPVEEGGGNLSAGQRMRIILARALLGNPSVLLLDEPDSHLDEDGIEILNNIIREFEGTLLLATHNPAFLKHSKIRWHLDDSSIEIAEAVA
ncbi:MAG: ABC transporter ATP-binding protein [Parasphingorhabdus sp.]|uniref:ABC transporter ATP-binding protein n=1 Tax=Parasphingorhabdus sp. TaxID=2709688 RepID=UPI003002F831|tara:strand:+ start:7066 stop:8724 length:1659 start_codon:yes stop_codon:yes gene_type:complete